MKRIFGILFLCAIVTGINAQESDAPVVSKGKFTLDFNFDPAAIFDAGAGPIFETPYIKGRYFLSSDMAFRLGFNVGFGGTKAYPNPDSTEVYNKTGTTSFTIAPGIEKQFKTNKLVVYVGADLPISTKSTKTTAKAGGTEVISKNVGQGGFLSVGLNAVVGVDYYLLPNLYVGAEFTPGLLYTKFKDEEVDGTVTVAGANSYNFGFAASSGVRIGVRF